MKKPACGHALKLMPDRVELTSRAMEAADLDKVCAIEQAANRFPWSRRNFADSLQSGHHAHIYLTESAQIAGFTVVQHVLDEAHLLNICVDPDWQGRGIGRQILSRVIANAQDRQMALVVLEVRRSNQRAQKLYLSQGFNEISTRPGYYPAEQGREDAVLMGLDLGLAAMFSSPDASSEPGLP